MKAIFFMFLISFAVTISAPASVKYHTGSAFVIEKTEFCSESYYFFGKFSKQPEIYINQVNTGEFKADIVLVYGNYIIAFDYAEYWKVVDNDYNNQFLFDYGNAAFSGWSDTYNKLCELQNVSIPSPDFYIDLFYVRHLNPLPNEVTIKIVNTATGEEKVHNTWSEYINRGALFLQTWLDPNEGLVPSFKFCPATCGSKMKEFFNDSMK